MNTADLIEYMIDNADETYGDNGDVVHYIGVMPLSFQVLEGFSIVENSGYITETTTEGIHYDFHEF